MRGLIVIWAVCWCAAFSVTAAAHEMSMAELQLRELAPGEFLWQWGTGEKRPVSEDLSVQWPARCHVAENNLHCGAEGLKGELTVNGVGERYSAALLKVYWLDGRDRVYTLTASRPGVQLFGGADDTRGAAEIAAVYTGLGVEHILSGVDHLLFVAGLLFLVGFERRLIWTVTAFTAAHSATLALSALGWLTLRSAPVEACIALSIVLVAGEALHTRPTLARRYPGVLAFLFGLVHGLGFAGALQDIGLPEHHLLPALLTFNLGVEIGQLAVLALAWTLWRFARAHPQWALARTPALYGIGSLAAYWSWERALAIFA